LFDLSGLVLQGRQIIERTVRPTLVVIVLPSLHIFFGIRQIIEPVHVQTLPATHSMLADTLRYVVTARMLY
jgi:hypothetical protein